MKKICLTPSLAQARRASPRFKRNRWRAYNERVRRLEKDLPELLNIFQFPRYLGKKWRLPSAIERRFVEVRRRTRPLVVFTNVKSVDRII